MPRNRSAIRSSRESVSPVSYHSCRARSCSHSAKASARRAVGARVAVLSLLAEHREADVTVLETGTVEDEIVALRDRGPEPVDAARLQQLAGDALVGPLVRGREAGVDAGGR